MLINGADITKNVIFVNVVTDVADIINDVTVNVTDVIVQW